jgi:hypothetical protein
LQELAGVQQLVLVNPVVALALASLGITVEIKQDQVLVIMGVVLMEHLRVPIPD